ncbi:putative MFS family arabinose efflux permease [Motilibacter peucedani]|uniref:Putative MFS family arabinose efflux permease n=1 Tax=Motilibacter peucedani TaxID=598650 RepID=A0A420XQ83_9ACTN|nr:MFS transporter [Motilibacter peucedani]RKS75407.1 putative MFS family arabinose efflux permease [Motilibacter peucedani]
MSTTPHPTPVPPPRSAPTDLGLPGDRLGRAGWTLLLVLCGTVFLDGLDVSMIGVALPSVGTALDLAPSTLQWVISGYVLGYGGFLLLGGRSSDLLGRRRVLLVGLAVFAAASLLTGVATDGTLLIGARFVKGAAAAFTAPATLSIITTRFREGPQRTKALTVYTATAASGFSLGLVLGGLLTSIGWRWTFLVPGPLALVLLALGTRFVPRDEPGTGRRSYDLPGAASITAAMLTLVITVVRAHDQGWGSPVTVLGFAASAALLATFVAVEHYSRAPLVRLGILRTPGLAAANLTAMTVFGSYVAFQFIAALYLQQTLGWSAVRMAFGLLPMGLLVVAVARPVGTLIDRYGPAVPLAGGMAAFVAGYAVFSRIGPSASYLAVVLPSTLLLGLGFGLAFASINTAATSGVRNEEQGLASGLVQTSFQLGGAVLLAVSTAVVEGTTGTGPDGVPTALDAISGYRAGLWISVGGAVLGLLVTAPALVRSVRARRAADVPDAVVLGAPVREEYAEAEV